MIGFNLEKLIVEEATDNGLVFFAIYHGISLEEPIMLKLVQRQADNLQCLMDKVKEFINEEEMLKAMKASQRSHRKPEARKRKEHI
jgi:ubiquinone/menaquinone biosynthesis C-methylase UbiE